MNNTVQETLFGEEEPRPAARPSPSRTAPARPADSEEPPKGVPRVVRVYGDTIVLDQGDQVNWTLEQIREYLEKRLGYPEFTRERTTMVYVKSQNNGAPGANTGENASENASENAGENDTGGNAGEDAVDAGSSGYIVPVISARKGGGGVAVPRFTGRRDMPDAPGSFCLLARNGVVVARRTPVGLFSHIVAPCPPGWDAGGLEEWPPGLEFTLPKMSFTLLHAAINIFLEVYNDCGCEAGVIVHYDTSERCYVLDVPDQVVTPLSFTFDREYLVAVAAVRPEWVEVLQMHSHTHPSIGDFSGVDDGNERSPQIYGLAVLGGERTVIRFRANCCGAFYDVDPDDIFEDTDDSVPVRLVTATDLILRREEDDNEEGCGGSRLPGCYHLSRQPAL